jgi:RNA polymerase sigma-70 factor (ECF subfamily)
MASQDAADVTALLQAWAHGEPGAGGRVMPLVYADLRRRAGAHLRRERAGHTLQPTALVHEAYLRLAAQDRADWQSRAQFLAVASRMMRRILIDHARGGKRAKRSGQWVRVTIGESVAEVGPPDVEVLDLDRALSELAGFDARMSRIAELRFFGGLSLVEIGDVLGISVATVEREWQTARAWLYSALEHAYAP